MSYFKIDDWSVIEDGFNPYMTETAESIFSIGNGHMGQRANFEEVYSGKSLQGSYVAGIYYPDKTRVGWWKNGYPEYFAKVLNAPNWIGIDVSVNGYTLDLAKCEVLEFKRILNMKEGILSRIFTVRMPDGTCLKVRANRFVSLASPEIGVVDYAVTALNDLKIIMEPYIDGDVRNNDSNYDEPFWDVTTSDADSGYGLLLAHTKKLDFTVGIAMKCDCLCNKKNVASIFKSSRYRTANRYNLSIKNGETITVRKVVAVSTSMDYDAAEVAECAKKAVTDASAAGINALKSAHIEKWSEIWRHGDIAIEGDTLAQQGIRFNIFHLNQTYTGNDARLNIGPKGFTGEKYGGCTYWDTEAFCIPFFLSTAPSSVSRNLLLYRYWQLEKAIKNAKKLGFRNGAALFPMVTMNGEECHNEWEITFEEIHRNGAIAFAIYNYIRHTGDMQYLAEYGLEVLIGIARFWCQRVNRSPEKNKYVILGVTGPNEYENNVNNNWYTNTIASWSLHFASEATNCVREFDPHRYKIVVEKTNFDAGLEVSQWLNICANMYYPYSEKLDIYLQQDGYLDKENVTVNELDPGERPLNQHWSWDKILRSPYIKQADTLQGIYLFEDDYDTSFIRRHFDFYEARTVHESSLSACIHSILAARIGEMEKAYDLYLRTARLDLDDYNCEVSEGLHITSMAGTWMAIVEGFGGKRIKNGKLSLNPSIPKGWSRYAFRLVWKNQPLLVAVMHDAVELTYEGPDQITIEVYGTDRTIAPHSILRVSR